MDHIGILAYGSLIDDPGEEIKPEIARCIKGVKTPFKVEFARKSRTRGNAPTLVPVEEGGAFVQAKVLVLKCHISKKKAMNMLWRRETRQVGTYKPCNPTRVSNMDRVCIEQLDDFSGIQVVLYTKIAPNITNTTPKELAALAIESAKKAGARGKDGISYLISAKNNGIKTPLMPAYEEEILYQTRAKSLQEALQRVQLSDHLTHSPGNS